MNKERLEKLQQWEAEKPNDAFLKFALSQEYISGGQDAEALKYLLLLEEQFTDYLATYYQLAKLYERSGETDKAVAAYTKGMEVAKAANDTKTLRELNAALEQLQDE
jgi:predicted Zn-dependent protease